MRIGLIAMSGIRVCDADLLRAGLTLPGFVERGKAIASLPSLGLLTLAGMTPAKHTVRYIEVSDLSAAEPIAWNAFDLVAISSYTAQIADAYAIAERCRAAGVPVVMGGPHVSVLPVEAHDRGATAVIGHGELHWRAVLSDAAAGRLRPTYGSLEDDVDLADSPVPAYELLDIDRYNRLTVQTSRGCPHRCEFCAGSVLFCRAYRQKPARKVIEELDRILTIWRHPFIELADDNSFVNRAYWMELLPAIRKRRIRWFTETDISVGKDDELLDALRRSGCAEVLVGLESPDAAGLDGLELRANWKMHRLPRYREILRNIQDHGIRVNGCFILGLDGQGPDVFDHVRDFVRDADLFDVQVTIHTPFPGTSLYARLKTEGRLTHDGDWSRCTLFDVNFRPRNMTVDDLERGLRSLIFDLYGEKATAQRRTRFQQRLRTCRRREKECVA